MRKSMIVVLALMGLVVGIVGCKKEDAPDPKPPVVPPVETPEAPEE